MPHCAARLDKRKGSNPSHAVQAPRYHGVLRRVPTLRVAVLLIRRLSLICRPHLGKLQSRILQTVDKLETSSVPAVATLSEATTLA